MTFKLTVPFIMIALASTSCSQQEFSGGSGSAFKKLKTETPDGPPTPPILTTTTEILEKCATETKKTKKVTVNFAADKKVCHWGKNGNLTPKQGRISAVEVQYQEFDAKEAAAVCGLQIYATKNQFKIDDEAVFTLSNQDSGKDYVLYSDWFSIKRDFSERLQMQKSNDVVIFDRSRLIGSGFSHQTPEFAPGVVGGSTNRSQSSTGVVGRFDFKVLPQNLWV